MTVRYSVLVPVYNEEGSILELTRRLHETFAALGAPSSFEVIFIDDGSTDGTVTVLDELASADSRVRVVRFRRNSGKSLALMAGLQHVQGDIVITIDGDLQDDPADIPLLLAALDRGYDLVTGWRQNRQDLRSRKLGSRIFNRTVSWATGLDLNDLNCGFKAFTKDVASQLCLYGDYHRYIPVLAHINGFRVTETPVKNDARKYGTSKYRTFRYQGFFDLLSLLFIYRYGMNPMHFFGVISLFLIVP
ncbi:MAG: glycosyltransferase family 2 protein, partial [Proteobacteria bacterium]|nr:glycosyltransferase family 2 protein [Pseudomonadota bacterium]